mmetsp:Transcript_65878/g.142902  ORF Transcript_65878/g.142902 Transcript_65878/m.142902 type:complete len:322 (-) Transcript_65878:25-990(-)
MPARKPGGKYKGVVMRAKGEETLLAEVAENRQKALDEHIARLEEKRENDLRAAEELKRRKLLQQEAMRQRIIGMWIGGRRGNVKKFFRAWIVGMRIYKQEQRCRQRDLAWRQSCSCLDPSCAGSCGAYLSLRDASFKMPFEIARERGLELYYPNMSTFMDSYKKVTGAATRGSLGMSTAPTRRTMMPGDGHSPIDKVGAMAFVGNDGALQRSWSFSGGGLAAAAARRSVLGPGGGPSDFLDEEPKEECVAGQPAGAWPCRCKKCRMHQTSLPGPPFVDRTTAKVMIHHKTGRRCLVDPATMRMTLADVTRPHVLGPSRLVI